MKKVLLTLLLCSTAFTQMPGQKPVQGTPIDSGHDLSHGLVGMWIFNDNPGVAGTTYDLSGNGNNGTLIADTYSVPGKFGIALVVDGALDHISIPFTADQGADALTVLCWIKAPGSPGSTQYPIGHYENSSSWVFYWFYETDNDMVFRVNNSADDWQQVSLKTNTIEDGKWHQVVGVWDGATLYAYLDGVDKSVSAGSLSGVTDSLSQPLTFGVLEAGSGAFAGQFDHVMIWDRALTASEITKLYSKPFGIFERERLPIASAAAPPAGGQVIMIITSGIPLWVILILTISSVYSKRRIERID